MFNHLYLPISGLGLRGDPLAMALRRATSEKMTAMKWRSGGDVALVRSGRRRGLNDGDGGGCDESKGAEVDVGGDGDGRMMEVAVGDDGSDCGGGRVRWR